MKKLLLICLAILPLCFASCEKEADDILAGSTYATTVLDYPRTFIEFKKYGKGEQYVENKDGKEIARVKFTHTYNHPYLSVKRKNGTYSSFTMADDMQTFQEGRNGTKYYLR